MKKTSRWRHPSVIVGSAIVLTFIRILGTFGTPALLGLPVRFFTLSTQIFNSLNARNSGDGFVLALVLVVMAAAFIYANTRILGVRKSFVTLTGKGFRQNASAMMSAAPSSPSTFLALS